MTQSDASTAGPSPAVAALLAAGGRLRRGEVAADVHSVTLERDDGWSRFYRDRWAHDKVVRSTHGVNCTGSCAWDVYVKDGLITWEHQGTDYPTTGPDSPEYEPRGCPRGASFSWYTYSPARVRYPYVRGVLLELYLQARCETGDPVLAWEQIVSSPLKATLYKQARGAGGFVRVDWDLATEIMAAAHVYTIKTYGPDRCVGFTPIPAMSMASFAAGTRFLSMIGGTLLSFYDWYADLPPASPQVWGDQTDVPESADWWNSSYIVMWGANVPLTRTPDAHFLTEARYKGTKVVVVSPDYAENVKFADDWLAAAPGTDGALAFAMGHVLLSEFYRDRQVPYFQSYAASYTDAPFLVRLRRGDDGTYLPAKNLTAADLDGGPEPVTGALGAQGAFRPVLLDAATDTVTVPPGTLADRWTPEGEGRWNLDLDGIEPVLTLHGVTHAGRAAQGVEVTLPRFDTTLDDGHEGGGTVVRGVPALELADGTVVTTVLDLMFAQYGVPRDGLPGAWPTGYDDAAAPGTPAWASEITGVPAETITRIAREFTRNAEVSNGRSMILMGAGTNHWFHSDAIYRTFIALLTLTGCQGVNGGGWGHYVGQEKARPVTGQQHISFALDWQRPTRHMTSTSFWYVATDQWRYAGFGADELASPTGTGALEGRSVMDCLVTAARLGWTPSHPGFNRNPLDLTDEAAAAGVSVADHIVAGLKDRTLRFAVEDPDDPANFPRVLTTWRANLIGNSAKGNEYFLKHLLGVPSALRAPERPAEVGTEVDPRPEGAVGKLDLLTNIDFRMTSSSLFSDIVLPAATWYEKQDISTTDMHPFVHALDAAIAPPWQARSDWEVFTALADQVSALAATHLGTRTDVIAAPLTTDTPDEMAQPHGVVADWSKGECEPIPGLTMPKLVTIERDYTQIGAKVRAVGPLVSTLGTTTKGITVKPDQAVAHLAKANGVVRGGVADGRPALNTAADVCEAILALSGTTNGHVSIEGFRALEKRVGKPFTDLAEENAERQITFPDTLAGPQPVFSSYEWSGSEKGGRRYSPFTINVERHKPWHTLTGRQHFFLDHDWMTELGEQLPVYRPPLDMARHFGDQGHVEGVDGASVTVRYLTPHSKWSMHSQFQDNPFMLALSRGGPTIWMSPQDADAAGVADNDWIEAVNRNGVVVARAVVSHRMPQGTAYMYHAKDRNIDVPKATASGLRGGIHNSLTAILVKPTHLLGGYGQLTYAFNYYGPTGNQRDEYTVIRRRDQKVEY